MTAPTNVVTERAGNTTVNVPSTTGTAACASRFLPAAVTQGASSETVPPAIVKS